MEFPIWVKNSQCHWKQWNYSANAHRGDYDISLKVDEMYETTRNKVKDFILYCNTILKDFSFSPCYFVDFIFDVNNFN